jgi:RND family efflux transporter MFP subunit
MAFSLALLVRVVGCAPQVESPLAVEEAPLPEIRVAVMSISPQPWPSIVRTQGSLAADEITTVGAKVAGRIIAVNVDLGDPVQASQPLLSLDQEEFLLSVAQTEAQWLQARAAVGLKPEDDVANLNPLNAPPVREAQALWDEAKQQVERIRQLTEKNAASEAQLQQVEAEERVCEARHASAINSVREKIAMISVRAAELSLARERLAEAQVQAPFEGVVQNRFVAPGTYVQVGDPLVSLVKTSVLRFRGTIPERHAQALKIGQRLALVIESSKLPREAVVTRISPALDEMSRSLLFEATIENPSADLRPGLFAEAEVVLNPEAQAMVIPRSALIRFAGVEKVWRVSNGVAGEVVVRVGRQEPDRVEILDGLAEGDVILRQGEQGQQAKVTALPASVADERSSGTVNGTASAAKREL